MDQTDYSPALVIGRGKGALAVVRSLGSRGVPVWVAADRRRPPSASRFAAGSLQAPDMATDPDGFQRRILDWAVEASRSPVLFPTDDISVEWIANRHSVLDADFCLIGPPPDVGRLIVDKATQYRFAQTAGLPLPRFWVVGEDGSHEDIAAHARFPLILRPRFSERFFLQHGFKALTIATPVELERSLATFTDLALVQELIPGGTELGYEYTSFVSDDVAIQEEIVLRKREVYPKPFGNTMAVETWREPAVLELGRQVIKVFEYKGISQSEFKWDCQSNCFNFIEINPRVVNNTGIERVAGIDTVWSAYAQATGQAHRHGSQCENRTVWHCPELRICYGRRLRLPVALPGGCPAPAISVTDLFVCNDPLPLLQKAANSCLDRMSRFRSELARLATEQEYSDVWQEIIDRTIHKAYRRGRLVIVEHTGPPSSHTPLHTKDPSKIEIRKLCESELPAVEKIVTRRTLARFRRYLAAGAICLCAWQSREPLGYTWSTTKMFPGILSAPIELPRGCAYTWGLFVAPNARGRGIGTMLAHARHVYETKRGNVRTRRIVRLDNPSAIRTIEKTLFPGSRIVGEIHYVKIFRRFFISQVAPERESVVVRRLRDQAEQIVKNDATVNDS